MVLHDSANAVASGTVPRSAGSALVKPRPPGMVYEPGHGTGDCGVSPVRSSAAAVTTLNVEPGGNSPRNACLPPSVSATARTCRVSTSTATIAAGSATPSSARAAACCTRNEIVVRRPSGPAAGDRTSTRPEGTSSMASSTAVPSRPVKWSPALLFSGNGLPSMVSVAGRATRRSLRRRLPPSFSDGCIVSGDQSTFHSPSRSPSRSTEANSQGRPSPATSRTPVNGSSAASSPSRRSSPAVSESDTTRSSALNRSCRAMKSVGGSATRASIARPSPASQASRYRVAVTSGPSGVASASGSSGTSGSGVAGSGVVSPSGTGGLAAAVGVSAVPRAATTPYPPTTTTATTIAISATSRGPPMCSTPPRHRPTIYVRNTNSHHYCDSRVFVTPSRSAGTLGTAGATSRRSGGETAACARATPSGAEGRHTADTARARRPRHPGIRSGQRHGGERTHRPAKRAVSPKRTCLVGPGL